MLLPILLNVVILHSKDYYGFPKTESETNNLTIVFVTEHNYIVIGAKIIHKIMCNINQTFRY